MWGSLGLAEVNTLAGGTARLSSTAAAEEIRSQIAG